jgi:hypothetical protein
MGDGPLKRVRAPRPRSDLSGVPLDFEYSYPTTWYRISGEKYPSPIFWSREGTGRFDFPAAKYGVLYLGDTATSAFQEIYGDEARKTRPINEERFHEQCIWKITVPAGMRLFSLTGPNLTRIKATAGSFTGSYPTSQAWAKSLMEHPDDVEGLFFVARRCGKLCLAVFGDAKSPRPFQAQIGVQKLGRITEWRGYLPLRKQLRLKVIPRGFVPPTFDAP